ncbi:MAG: CerR family C-terminal domain-containing protein [Planctomycetes bacterium]|nr:CerR family C-terminal domain-containing protein [Planctomycetota bacterium]
MRKQRKDARETTLRLLEAAGEVFARRGFWEATHAEICRKAGANTASVNYHFGSKENLYVEAWKHAFRRSMEAHPPDGGVAAEAPLEERLRGRILALIQRIGDPDNREFEIMHKEMANPTGLLTESIRQAIEPMRRETRSIVEELLGEGADDRLVHLCEMSVMGQCFGPVLRLRRARMAPDVPSPGPLPFDLGVEELADHVLRFSLAGIRGIRDEARRKSGAARNRGKRAVLRSRRDR